MKKRIITVFSVMMLTVGLMFAVKPNLVKNGDGSACEKWVDSVYKTLTLRQQVAQLMFPKVVPTQGEISKKTIKNYVEKNGMGGLLYTEGTAAQYGEMNNYAQSIAKVPVLMTLDGEWGLSMRIKKAPRFPKNMALGAVARPDNLYDYGKEVARECREIGIHVNFAPDVDVNSNPKNPVIGSRSFGDDPERVAELGAAYSKGLEDGKVQAVAKHFPGHGDCAVDSHKGLPSLNKTVGELDKIEFVPFKKFITDGCSGVMVGHVALPTVDKSGTPASLSSKITTGLLNNHLGFEGLVYTDALGMKGAKIDGKNSSVEALKAGADVLLSPISPVADINQIVKAVEKGQISRKLIEQKCKKVLRYKYLLGLANEKPVKLEGLEKRLSSPEAERVNRNLTASTITVVKNEQNILPLRNIVNKDIVIVSIGKPRNDGFTDMCRRYHGSKVYEVTSAQVPEATLRAVKKSDITIVAVYEGTAWAQQAFASVSAKHSVVAAFMIDPYKIERFKASFNHAKALVFAFDDADFSAEYAAQAIYGGINVNGRMPVELPGIAKRGYGINLKRIRLGYGAPATVGLHASLTDSLDSIVNYALSIEAMPGCQLLVAKNGVIVHNKSYGKVTKGGRDVDDNTLYDMASVSKATGTLPAVMAVYDEGLIDLNAPASKYVPGLRIPGKDSITVTDLLYHETGIQPSLSMHQIMMDTTSYEGPLFSNKPDSIHTIKIQDGLYGHKNAKMRRDITSPVPTKEFPWKLAEGIYGGKATYDTVMAHIYNSPLRKNRNYCYSCLNFSLLMDINQHVTHRGHEEYAKEKIWDPIEAYNLCYSPGRKDTSNIAYTENDTFLRRQHLHGFVHDELAAFSGGTQGNAGLFGTTTDLAKLCQMWLNGGEYAGNRVLSEETVKLFTTSKSPNSHRGLGFDKPNIEHPQWSSTCDEADPSVYGHTGFTGTIFWVDPKNDVIFIFLANRVDPTRDSYIWNRTGIRPELFRQVYKAME